jgi:hypothetical protein
VAAWYWPRCAPVGALDQAQLLLLLLLPLLQVSLLVASAEGIFYRYSIDDLRNPNGPKCSLDGEWTLLGSVLSG